MFTNWKIPKFRTNMSGEKKKNKKNTTHMSVLCRLKFVIRSRKTRHMVKIWLLRFYTLVKGHLKPTHLKSSPLFTFITKSLGQDSPSIHLFSKTIGSRFIATNIKLGEDSPSWFFFLRQDSLSNKLNNRTIKHTLIQDSSCFKY